jgi:hypothetical protein
MHLMGLHLMGPASYGHTYLGGGYPVGVYFMGVQLLGRNCGPAGIAVELAALIVPDGESARLVDREPATHAVQRKVQFDYETPCNTCVTSSWKKLLQDVFENLEPILATSQNL